MSVKILTAEVYAAFLRWMREQPGQIGEKLAEGTRRTYAGLIADFFEWAPREGLIQESEVDDVAARFSAAFTGFRERQRRATWEEAVPPEVVRRLYDALFLEIQAGECAVAHPDLRAEYDPVLPLLPFPLLCGMMVGLRSAEWNVLLLKDVEFVPEHIWAHAPNKRPCGLYMPLEVQRAWRLALNWQRNYRTSYDGGTPAVLTPLLLSSSQFEGEGKATDQIRRFDTPLVRNALNRFYRKYFGITRPDGRPVLYQEHPETGEVIPLALPFVDYRSLAITEYSRMEGNLEKTRHFARHESLQTTLPYIRQTQDEVRAFSASTIGPFSERVRLRVQGRVATVAEMKAAGDQNALVPGGGCAEALEGKRECRRALDCRLCAYFLIDPRKREFFVGDATAQRAKARRAEDRNQMRNVQVHLGFAAIDDAIVQTIDLYQLGIVG